MEDLWAKPGYAVQDGKGTLDLTVKVSAKDAGQRPGKMQIRLSDAAGKMLLARTEFLQPQTEQTLHLREELAEKVTP